MAKFHGEYVARIRVGVVVEAESLDAAAKAIRSLPIDVNDTGTEQAHEWDVEPEEVALFEGEE